MAIDLHRAVLLGLLVLILFSARNLEAQNSELDSLLKVSVTAPKDTNKVKLYNRIGYTYVETGAYNNALSYSFQALELAQKLNYYPGLIKAYVQIGIVYWYQGDNKLALTYEFKGLDIATARNSKQGISNARNNIGMVYSVQSDYNRALEQYFAVLKILSLVLLYNL